VTETCLGTSIGRLLTSAQARRLCRKYGADPLEALGELYLRLRRRATTQRIDNPEAWVNVNGLGVLRNYLRREHVVRP
jgi:hypothetical protein